jgi:hypothetical protein
LTTKLATTRRTVRFDITDGGVSTGSRRRLRRDSAAARFFIIPSGATNALPRTSQSPRHSIQHVREAAMQPRFSFGCIVLGRDALVVDVCAVATEPGDRQPSAEQLIRMRSHGDFGAR